MLNLSYNKINFESISNLYRCRNLRTLDLAANNLETLPGDIFHLESLEELNLSSNYFSSVPSSGNPATLFKALGQISRLKRLNLSRNKFFAFHAEFLDPFKDFAQLQELDFSFNMVENEHNMWFLTMARSVNSINITGNPFATTSVRSIGLGGGYANFEIELAKNLSAVVINDQHLVDDKGYLKKPSKNNSQ